MHARSRCSPVAATRREAGRAGAGQGQRYLCRALLRITSVSWIVPSTTSAVASRTIFRSVVPGRGLEGRG